MGNLYQAAAHFEDALAFSRKAGYRPELAWTCCDCADALRERNGPGDRRRAMAMLDESLAISSELGMRPLTVALGSAILLAGCAAATPTAAPDEGPTTVIATVPVGDQPQGVGVNPPPTASTSP